MDLQRLEVLRNQHQPMRRQPGPGRWLISTHGTEGPCVSKHPDLVCRRLNGVPWERLAFSEQTNMAAEVADPARSPNLSGVALRYSQFAHPKAV